MFSEIKRSPTAIITYDPDSGILSGGDSLGAVANYAWLSGSDGSNPGLAITDDSGSAATSSSERQVLPRTVPIDPATAGSGTPDGNYPITLTVSDTNGDLAKVKVIVNVVNQVIQSIG